MNVAPVVYRNPGPEDEAFFFHSWLRSYQKASRWAGAMPSKIYYANHKKVVAKLLSESHVLVACNPQFTDQIFGYGVYQPTTSGVAVLHYLYVKQPYRRMGIATGIFRTILRLVEHNSDLPTAVTHIPDREFPGRDGEKWSSTWDILTPKWNLVFNPYLLGSEFFYETTSKAEAG